MGDGVSILATQFDEVEGNAVWCPAMQACWEALLDHMNGGRPMEANQLGDGEGLVRNLNRRESHAGNAGADHLYSYVGSRGIDNRRRIDATLMRVFGQHSDILDTIEWSEHPDPRELLCYAMLYAKFDFWVPFHRDDEKGPEYEGGFFGSRANGNEAEHVRYFGTPRYESGARPWNAHDALLNDAMKQQLWVLFHDGDDANAVAISSRTGDMLVLAKGLRGQTFAEMWDDLVARIPPYDAVLRGYEDGTRRFVSSSFECPMLSMSTNRQYRELEQEFEADDGTPCSISTALQTFRLSLDETGCEVRGEAALAFRLLGAPLPPRLPWMPQRNFVYDDEFVLFAVAMQNRRNWGRDAIGHERLMDVIRSSQAGTVQLLEEGDGKHKLGVPFPATLASAYPYMMLQVSDIVAFQDGARHAERTDGGPRRTPPEPDFADLFGDDSDDNPFLDDRGDPFAFESPSETAQDKDDDLGSYFQGLIDEFERGSRFPK